MLLFFTSLYSRAWSFGLRAGLIDFPFRCWNARTQITALALKHNLLVVRFSHFLQLLTSRSRWFTLCTCEMPALYPQIGQFNLSSLRMTFHWLGNYNTLVAQKKIQSTQYCECSQALALFLCICSPCQASIIPASSHWGALSLKHSQSCALEALYK